MMRLNEIDPSEIKLGMYLISIDNEGPVFNNFGAVVTQLSENGFTVRDTGHNNCYFVTWDELKHFKLPYKEHELTRKELEDHGSGICNVNWAWRQQIGEGKW